MQGSCLKMLVVKRLKHEIITENYADID